MTPSADRGVAVAGLGHALPPRVVTNDDLAARIDTSDEWIRSRTGIRSRHVVDAGAATSDLAVEAGAKALAAAGVSAVDVVVVATTTPDHRCPPRARRSRAAWDSATSRRSTSTPSAPASSTGSPSRPGC